MELLPATRATEADHALVPLADPLAPVVALTHVTPVTPEPASAADPPNVTDGDDVFNVVGEVMATVGAALSMLTKVLLRGSVFPTLSVERKRTYFWQAVPTPQASDTVVPVVVGEQLFAGAVSTQYRVLATPEPLPSLPCSETIWSDPTQPVPSPALVMVVGAAASTVRVTAVPAPFPALFVARIFSVSRSPLVPVMPVCEQMKFGAVPETEAGSQVVPLVVYSQPVTALSLLVKLVLRVNGLLTKFPN